MVTPTEKVKGAYRAISARSGDELFISLAPEAESLAAAEAVEARLAAGELVPLAGVVAAAKDNIDVAGMATTAGCPDFAYLPERDATCVQRLVRAGVVFVGKTNLDQFATGLVGTRSPYGAPASVLDPARISGGSSSGSAVAVALGLVDLALGTDTAGSGRVPASFNAVIGTKPTHGLVPATGVVPACPSFDCVSLFTTSVALASLALAVLSGPDGVDPLARNWPSDAPLSFGPRPVIAVPDPAALAPADAPFREAFAAAERRLAALGAELRTVDVGLLLEAGALLYGGALVAERYAAVGRFVESHREAVDPVVGAIITAAARISAEELIGDVRALGHARIAVAELFSGCDALMMPTVPEHPSFAEVAADPIAVNSRLGRYSTFCNLLDLAAIAVPVPGAHPASLGVTLFGPAFSDGALAELAARFSGEEAPGDCGAPAEEVVVVGAHLSGQPLNHQLTAKGGRLVRSTRTAPSYRLYALPTTPPKPGLVRAATGGGAIEVEVWALPPARFAAFVREIAEPLALGPVSLADGSVRPGFLLAAGGAPRSLTEITHLGGWRSYLASLPR